MKRRFTKQVDRLRYAALGELDIMSPLCVRAVDYDAVGFFIKDDCCQFEQLIWLDGQWQLVDERGLLYSVYSIPLEDLCSIIDDIIDDPEYERS